MRKPLILAVLVCGCGDPAAAWVGRYEGTFISEAVDCATGDPLEPYTEAVAIEIVQTPAGELLIDSGECPIPLDLTGATSARIVPGTCDGTLSDGTPVRYERLNGRLDLDGDELSFSASVRTTVGGLCDSSMQTFVGTRR